MLPTKVKTDIEELEGTLEDPYVEIMKRLKKTKFLSKAPCDIHPSGACSFPAVHGDSSGPPCKDASTRGKGDHHQGLSGKLHAVWALKLLHDDLPWGCHECTSRYNPSPLLAILQDRFLTITPSISRVVMGLS